MGKAKEGQREARGRQRGAKAAPRGPRRPQRRRWGGPRGIESPPNPSPFKVWHPRGPFWTNLSRHTTQTTHTDVYCSPPEPIYKGQLHGERSDGYTEGDTLIISCEEGFQLQGSSEIRCTADGEWDVQPPICKRELRVGRRSFRGALQIQFSCRQFVQTPFHSLLSLPQPHFTPSLPQV